MPRIETMLGAYPHHLKIVVVARLILLGFLMGSSLNAAYGQSGAVPSRGGILFVLDASNSMWGQVKEQPKIAVARSVMRRLVSQVPEGVELGLVAYGHRRKSDCSDVETLLPLAANSHQLFSDAVESLTPKGMTPLTAAVTQAVRLVDGRDDTPTVVILSDGVESCEGDPCQAVQDAIASGSRFTLHTIGFDLRDEESRQLKCMAEAGGGQFHIAKDAGQLLKSMQEAVKEEAPEVVLRSIGATTKVQSEAFGTLPGQHRLELHSNDSVFQDELLETGSKGLAQIRFLDDTKLSIGANSKIKLDSFVYRDTNSNHELVLSGVKGLCRFISGKMIKKSYKITTAVANIGIRGTDFVIRSDSGNRFWVLDGQIEITSLDSGLSRLVNAGGSVSLDPGGAFRNEEFEMPADPGLDLATGKLVLEATARIGGGQVDPARIDWSVADSSDNAPVNDFKDARRSLHLLAGKYMVTGTYEGQLRKKAVELAADAIETVSFQFDIDLAKMMAPDSAPMSNLVEIAWEGPGNEKDFITVARPDQAAREYENYVSLKGNNPVQLLMPDQPGDYEIRYILQAGSKLLARVPITVLADDVELSVPEAIPFGGMIEVAWAGPDGRGDYISVAEPASRGGAYVNFAHTIKGSPAKLRMPDKPGNYEVRYISGQSRRVLASVPVSVPESVAELAVPEQAAMGQVMEIAWQGPDNKNDYISVASPGARGRDYLNYTYTRQGSPAKLLMPDEPGIYEIRYVSGKSHVVLQHQPIEIVAVNTTIAVPDKAAMGAGIDVSWTGPDSRSDYISVAKPEMEDGKYINFRYTRTGNPVSLMMPDEAGLYEIRYVSHQSKRVLARHTLKVTDVVTTLKIPATATMGENTQVFWSGPDNKNDYITVVEPEAKDNKHGKYTYTRKGNPLALVMPDVPGNYEIRYVSNQSKIVLARETIEVESRDPSLSALMLAPIRKPFRIHWEGPNGYKDRITVANPSDPAKKAIRFKQLKKSPIEIRMPDQPGDYELRYVTGQTHQVLHRRLVTVMDEADYAEAVETQATARIILEVVTVDGTAIKGGAKWSVYGIDGHNKTPHKSAEMRPVFDLRMGIYRANVSIGGKSSSVEYLVNPGEDSVQRIVVK